MKRKGLTLIEILVVVSIIGLLSVCFWSGDVKIFPVARDTLVKQLVQDLNEKVQLFESLLIQEGAEKPSWMSKDEALEKLTHRISQKNDLILVKTLPKAAVVKQLDWDCKHQQFKIL